MKSSWAQAALVVLAASLAYHNTLGGTFHYDDEHAIVANPHIRALGNIPRFFVDPGTFSGLSQARMYRPLVLTSLALNYAVDGYQPRGYLAVNLILHLACAVLVWYLGRQLVGPGALVAGLLFAVHPLAGEPVNYISSRSSQLAALFILAGMVVCGRVAQRGPRGWDYGLLAVFQALALGSKAVGVVLVVLAAGYLRWLSPPGTKLRVLGPALGIVVLYLVGVRDLLDRALVAEPVRSGAVQLATQLKALAFYGWKTVMPVHLSVEPQFAPGDWSQAAVWLAACLLLVLASGMWSIRRHVGGFGLYWFGVCLLPTAVVPLNVLVNEHRLYVALAGACWLLAALGHRWFWGVVLVLGVLAARGNAHWQSQERLWAVAVAQGPQMVRPLINLSKLYLEQGRLEEALVLSRRAIELDPGQARAHYNLATAHLQGGNGAAAVAGYRRALALDPHLVEALNNLGNALTEDGQVEEALKAYQRALTLSPSSEIHHNMGQAQLRLGRLDAARRSFLSAVEADQDNLEARLGLAKATPIEARLAVLEAALKRWPAERRLLLLMGESLAAAGRLAEAREVLLQVEDGAAVALRLATSARGRGAWSTAEAHVRQGLANAGDRAPLRLALGQVLAGMGRYREALAELRRAAVLDANSAEAFAGIGAALLKLGSPREGVAAFERAVALNGEHGLYWAGLGQASSDAGKVGRAMEAYREAIKHTEDAELRRQFEARLQALDP